MKGKAGVETIDVNSFLFEAFCESGFDDLLSEAAASPKEKKIDFKRIAKNLGDAKDVISTLQKKTGGNPTADKDEEYSSDENVAENELETQDEPETEAPAEEEAPPMAEAPQPEKSDKVVKELSDLESMVADIAAEIANDDKEEN